MKPSDRARRLSVALGLGDAPASTLGPLRAFYAKVDGLIAEKSGGLGLPCRAGCSACCYESVFVSAPEFLAVADALVTERPEQLESTLAAMKSLSDHFADELELLEWLEAGPERDEVAARVRFRCPLLGDDERCTVYEVRELNARTFGQSYDHRQRAPYGCEKTHDRLKVLNGPVERLPDAWALRRALAEAVSGVERVHVYPWWFDRYGASLV